MESTSPDSLKIVLFGRGARADAVAEAVQTFDGVKLTRIGPETNVNDPIFLKHIGQQDLFIVGGFPQIFKKPLLDVPKFGTWNCHAGPVPEYRGGSPLNWQIIDGRTALGISLLLMDEGIDTGPVIGRAGFPLSRSETIADAHEKANHLFAGLVKDAFVRFVDCLLHGTTLPVDPQSESKSYRKQRSDADGEIDLTWDGQRIVDIVRALTHPYPGAWIKTQDGKKLRIWSATLG